jgi:hypothetical protein
MWPVAVVMGGVLGQDVRQVSFADDEHPVGALAPYRADPAFGEGVRPRRLWWRAEHVVPAAVNTASNAAVNFAARSTPAPVQDLPDRAGCDWVTQTSQLTWHAARHCCISHRALSAPQIFRHEAQDGAARPPSVAG